MNLQSWPAFRARAPHWFAILTAYADRHWKWLTFLIWIAIAVAMVVSRWPAIHWLVLGDTDDNIRYVQVKDWLAGQGWYDLRQYRLDPPGGANIHWSRLVDIPLALVIGALTPLVGQSAAEGVALIAVPLLTLLVAMAFVAPVAIRLFGRETGGWAVLGVKITPALLAKAGTTVFSTAYLFYSNAVTS